MEKKIRGNEIILALLLAANFVAGAISLVFSINNIYVLFINILCLISISESSMRMNRKLLLLIFAILFQITWSFVFVRSYTTTQFALCFIAIAIPCFLISAQKIEIKGVLKKLQWIGLLCTPYYIHLIKKTYTVYNSGDQMGIAYSMLPIMLSAIIILINNKEFKKSSMRLALYNIVLSSAVYIQLMTRGALLCIFICMGLAVCIKIRFNKKYLIYCLLISIVILLVYFVFLRSFAESSSWYYNMFLSKKGNILNGRETDLSNILYWPGIDKFLFGHGIGSYKQTFNLTYVHNLIGHLYFEQGIVIAFAMLIIIVKGFFSLFDKENEDKWMLLLLLCGSIVRLMLSYYFWIDQLFWIFMYYIICKSKKRKIKVWV